MDVNQELQALSNKGLQKVNKKPNGGYSRLKVKYRALQVKLDTTNTNLAASREQEEHYKRLYLEERSEKNSILSRETRMKKDLNDKLTTAAEWERDLNTTLRNLVDERMEKQYWKSAAILTAIMLVNSLVYNIFS